MRILNATSVLLSLAMVWVGFAASATTFEAGRMQDMMDQGMAMTGCPEHAAQMTMDTNKCAVACYGLASQVEAELVVLPPARPQIAEVVPAMHGWLDGRFVKVPTPPPDFV